MASMSDMNSYPVGAPMKRRPGSQLARLRRVDDRDAGRLVDA